MTHRESVVPCMVLAWIAFVAVPATAQTVEATYEARIEEFRASRDQGLRSPDGWLTLAGLHWLEPGENRFGNDPDLAVPLEADGIPARAGSLWLEGETVTVRVASAAPVELDGEPVSERVLHDDTAEGGPDVLTLGGLRFYVIRRGDRFGVRVKDPEHPRLKNFRGLDFYPIDRAYRFDATFTPFDEPREVRISSAVGTTAEMLEPGSVEFTIDGRRHSLRPLVSEPGETELWFIFSDKTSGKETYGFRYLYGELSDGRVDLDFNRAYNPPCAFSPHATCPLPPRGNGLDVRIEAGERAYVHP